jgi:hypothetical protein
MAARGVRLFWWIAGGCGLALLTALLILVFYALFRGWTPGKVERAVNQALPPGSNRESIEGFLDAHGWARSYSGPENSFYAREIGLKEDQVSGVVFGHVPDPNVDPFDRGAITLLFFLDRDGRLIKSYVRVWIEGP